MLLVSAVGLTFAGRWRRLGRVWLAAAVVVGTGAVLSKGVGTIEVTSPFGPAVTLPSTEEALAVFAPLHANIYRAFDYTEDERIYDTLAETVEGDLLDRVYAEVYGSLILRKAGGAVSRVEKTEILESQVEYSEDPDARRFAVVSRWRVRGAVTHQKHTHRRLNEYQARFEVRWQGEDWKISDMKVLKKDRLPVKGG